jgi:hypothetical protein
MYLALPIVTHCAEQSKTADEKKPVEKTETQTGDNNAEPSTPVTTATPATNACDDQWKAHVSFFKPGLVLTYKSKISALAQEFPVVHTEKVIESNDLQVTRSLSISTTNSLGAQILSQIKKPPQMILKKEKFLQLCDKASKSVQPQVGIGSDKVQVVESKVDAYTPPTGGSIPAQYYKLQTTVAVQATQVPATAEIWGSQKVPGLGLKQILVVSGIPIAGTATLTDELVSPSPQ